MKKLDFFDRLYAGFEGEYFVLCQLFRAGYEGFKMPGDFGFDLVATDQKQRSINNNLSREISAPYPIQVKSRRVGEEYFYPGPNGRPSIDVEFWISKAELDLLADEESSALVCIANVSNESYHLNNIQELFWIPGFLVEEMKSEGYISFSHKDKNKQKDIYKIKLTIRYLPTFRRDNELATLLDKGEITEKGKKSLESLLPEEININWNASKGVYLNRPAKNSPEHTVSRILSKHFLSLDFLGQRFGLGNLSR